MDEPDQSLPDESAAAEKKAMSEGQSGYSESDATVLTPTSALPVSELPAGMTPRELAHTLQGEMLDHFKLQQFVGGGGMGVVFKALDTTLDRVVAVKVVASRSINSEDLQKRFLIEAQSAARLDHPNIARVYDSGRSRGLPYIVFEYIEGANIRDLVVNHGPLPLGDALSYTYQIAHALAHAWQRDVVHRDIKPSNILVNQEGLAKLVDMGLARLYQVGVQDDDLTSTGVTLGTFDYISPEQARDPRLADTRSDIYSLGCTLFYMLAGHAPFSEGTAAQKLLQHQEEEPPELLTLRDDIPESLNRLVQRMLAKSPELRPQTSSDVVAELSVLMGELGLHLPHALAPTPLAVPVQIIPSWRKHVPWIIPVSILLIASVWMNAVTENSIKQIEFPPIREVEKKTVDEVQVSPSAAFKTPPEPSATVDDPILDDLSGRQLGTDISDAPAENTEAVDGLGKDDGQMPSEALESSVDIMSIPADSSIPPKLLPPGEEKEEFQTLEFFGPQKTN